MKRLLGIIVLLAIIALCFYFASLKPKTETQSAKEEVAVVKTTPVPHTDFKEITRLDPSKKQVAITINAGMGERSAEGILAALKKHNYKTSFFLVGKWVREHPELTRRIAAEGHEIFNHSDSHRDFTKLTPDEIKIDLQKMDDTLFQIAGIHTRPYFRAPFGYRNEMVKKAAEEIGFQHIYWSIDSIDWREGETEESIKERILTHLHSGAIILIHIGDHPTGEIADELFTEIKARGYELVSLTEALGEARAQE